MFQANELLYGGRKITAMEAYQLGLVSQVFWPTLMMQEVIPRAQNMAACSAKVTISSVCLFKKSDIRICIKVQLPTLLAYDPKIVMIFTQ